MIELRIRLLCLVVIESITMGCGSQVVAPGPPAAVRHAPASNRKPADGVPATPTTLRDEPGDPPRVTRVPAASLLALPAEQEARYHRVIEGDTLSSIARRYGVSVAQLLEGNGLDPNVPLQPDQLIFVPEGP